jgi:hypothetical protein
VVGVVLRKPLSKTANPDALSMFPDQTKVDLTRPKEEQLVQEPNLT